MNWYVAKPSCTLYVYLGFVLDSFLGLSDAIREVLDVGENFGVLDRGSKFYTSVSLQLGATRGVLLLTFPVVRRKNIKTLGENSPREERL